MSQPGMRETGQEPHILRDLVPHRRSCLLLQRRRSPSESHDRTVVQQRSSTAFPPHSLHRDARGKEPKPDVLPFAHGETVPPCKTCAVILPLMLCPGDKVECNHKS